MVSAWQIREGLVFASGEPAAVDMAVVLVLLLEWFSRCTPGTRFLSTGVERRTGTGSCFSSGHETRNKSQLREYWRCSPGNLYLITAADTRQAAKVSTTVRLHEQLEQVDRSLRSTANYYLTIVAQESGKILSRTADTRLVRKGCQHGIA